MTRALILDFDGTIVDTETTLFQAYAEVFEEHGQELDRAFWLTIIGTDSQWDPLEELERLIGRALDPSVVERRRRRRDELIDAAGVRPGVLDWLGEAETLRMPVGIASSSPAEWVEGHLARLGLSDRFSCLACCSDAIPAKPDPTSYRHACEALGADPRRSVAVEDSAHGISAATGAGLFTVAVPHDLTASSDLSRADLVLASLEDRTLREVLDLR